MILGADSPATLLAACGGDTVKLFDVSVGSGDPCVLTYSPSPGFHINSIKWNHTNLVVASAGDDKTISLWHKNGQGMGMLPVSRHDASDDIEESIYSISFSNKSSRYLCSGGSSRMLRIWDLQRKRCIKWLSGHTDTVTGVMYNCKDEHLASISLKGALIVHNLASGARAAELKDPNEQPLRTLDYSRVSRHSLVTAGDDGSVHMWDTTGRSPKVSWLKQHSAPSTGVCISPSSDKIISSIGLDKKLYTFDSGIRRPTSCIPYETPFASLAYSDGGNVLAAGTNSGSIVFYDVRGKPQPLTVLRAYNNSEVVTSLCWQRSKPVIVNENTCTAEIALLGSTSEESVLMPDPLPSLGALSFHSATTASSSCSSLTANSSGSRLTTSYLSTSEETPVRSRFAPGVSLSKLQAPHSNYNFKDDMDVFSPLADVQPITPYLSNQCANHDETRKDTAAFDKKSTLYSSLRRFTEGNNDPHPNSDWRFNPTSRQDDTPANPQLALTPVASSKSESSCSPTPPEAWGGNPLPDKLVLHRQPASKSTRFPPSVSLTSGPMFAGIQDSSLYSSHAIKNFVSNSSLSSTSVTALNTEKSSAFPESSSTYHSTTVSNFLGTKAIPPFSSLELPGLVSATGPRKYSTYAERISTTASFSDGTSSATGSPKFKKTGAETKEELMNIQSVRQEAPAVAGTGNFPMRTDVPSQGLHGMTQDQLGTSSFSLQLVQRTLEETLGSVERSIHEDVRNLHIDLLRQFHMQETEMTSLLSSVLEKLDELTREVHSLRRENQQLRQLL